MASPGYTFKILQGSDKEYVEAIERVRSEGKFSLERVVIGELGELPVADYVSRLQEVLSHGMGVLPYFSFNFSGQINVRINRSGKDQTIFDEVIVSKSRDGADSLAQANLAAAIQKHLGESSLINIGNMLGPGAREHFEAREAALSRLERTAAMLMEEMESARKRRESEYESKEKSLEARYEAKRHDLEELNKKRQEEQDQRAAELKRLQEELDDRAATHARRQHYKDLKEKFKSWSEEFKVTQGTKGLRRTVFWFTLALLVLFGSMSGWFLFESFRSDLETARLSAAIVKQVTFTLLFVSTAYFFIRWNNQWFQRHADEEFRLKRLELDIDRASWFVEMAFEWKDEKGEQIPLEIIERLTRGLFADGHPSEQIEPVDSLAQALFGAARFKAKLSDGTEVEYDRKGIEKLLRTHGME